MQRTTPFLVLLGWLGAACGGDDTAGDGGARPDASSETAPDAAVDAGPGLGTVAACFADLASDADGPDYDQFDVEVGSHCMGTNHQDITGVEKLVILGDSVSQGTPPTPADQFYRVLLADWVVQKFGDVEVVECADNGARNDDLLIGKQQIPACAFPDGIEEKTTLIVFTSGGNDISAWAGDALSAEDATVEADAAADLLDDAVAWLKDPAHFPNGSYVIFANPYEYTDGTGDLMSCPLAVIGGLAGNWIEGEAAVLHFQERYMQTAIEHGADMIFTLEQFCGHGYRREDPEGRCYRGPDAELWFDLTCIHPTPAGHQQIAEMFMSVIDE